VQHLLRLQGRGANAHARGLAGAGAARHHDHQHRAGCRGHADQHPHAHQSAAPRRPEGSDPDGPAGDARRGSRGGSVPGLRRVVVRHRLHLLRGRRDVPLEQGAMSARQPTRVLILGGGFGGLSAALHFERALPADDSVEVFLINRDNYLLFTPMLAEVAMGEVNPLHIAVPLRAFLRRVHVRQAEIVGIDLAQRKVKTYFDASDETDEVSYDHLILALGSVTSYHHAPGAETHAFPFKTLGDAARIRDRVIDCFEQAAHDDNPDHRRALLTFVVAGGGFSGVELAAALADFVRETRRFYPRLAGEKLHLVLAHHGHRLLEELDEASAAYTLTLL